MWSLLLLAISPLLRVAWAAESEKPIDDTNFCFEKALYPDFKQFQEDATVFRKPGEDVESEFKPQIYIVDDFYPTEEFEHVLSLARSAEYVPYWPPEEGAPWQWNSSALYVRIGELLDEPFEGGDRHCDESLRVRLAKIVGDEIPPEHWRGLEETASGGLRPTAGDGWNCAFHRFNSRWVGGAVHHHWKVPDIAPSGWSGLVFLEAAEVSTCTSFWRDRETGLVVGTEMKSDFSLFPNQRFDLAHVVWAKPNRLVLFREAVYHRAEAGGEEPYRTTQTFFFVNTAPLPNPKHAEEPRKGKLEEL